MTCYAKKYNEDTDDVTCACGATFKMHYSDPKAYTWTEGPDVDCTKCMPEVIRALYKACCDSQRGWIDSMLKTRKVEQELERTKRGTK